jgi:hypothetical protein
LTIICLSASEAQTSAVDGNPTEKWVVDRLTEGAPANLDNALNADHTKKFPEEKDRTLSAPFLQGLLTGALPGVKLHPNGVRIIGATVDEPIKLANEKILCEVWLEHCQFNKKVMFANTSFAKSVAFISSSFTEAGAFIGSSLTEAADFSNMKVGGDARFDAAVFDGPVSFAGADIMGNFQAIGAKFRCPEKAADLSSMKVRGIYTLLNAAVFDGPVYFFKADFARSFSLVSAIFQGDKTGVFFNPGVFFTSITVGGDASLNCADFDASVYFTRADIAGNLVAYSAQFQNTQSGVSFWKLKVGGDASFVSTCFHGPVSFTRAEIIGNFQAIGAKFQDTQKGADFNNIKVGGDASFDHAKFKGPVDLRYTDFALLDLSNARWPRGSAQVQTQAISYKYIRAAPNETDSHVALFEVGWTVGLLS